ncbi:hypothetical protein REPUB_Repub09cG0105500 [Reevesia pubescens]
MAAILLFLVLSVSVTFTPAVQQRATNISLGSSLTPTSNISWMSPSGVFAFGFYPKAKGYLVGIFIAGIPQKTVVWTANRDKSPVPNNVTLNLTIDGRLILQFPNGQETIITENSNSSEPAATAAMLDSGNFILYDSDQKKIWQSFEYPTNTLLPGQRLYPGYQLFSSVSETDESTGRFRLKMQHDGNLVQYPTNTPESSAYAYWQAGTGGTGDNVTLNFDPDGHLYLLKYDGSNIHNITVGGFPIIETLYLMRIDVDGNFRLYSYKLNQNGAESVIWNSSNDKCAPKGVCGLNSYCVQTDLQINCTCLPTFSNIENGHGSFSSCARNFRPESCTNNDRSVTYSIETIASLIWEDNSYDVLKPYTQQDCETACLEDCMCEAATYKDGVCNKQKVPLRFGRLQLADSNIALIKVANSTENERNENLSKGRRKEHQTIILPIGVSLTAFGFTLLVLVGVLIYMNKFRAFKRDNNCELIEDVPPRSFTYDELEKATNNFKEEVGRGSFGTVFKGELSNDQKIVAVKRLDNISTLGDREFQTEMRVIARTNHRNLIRLLGYCHDESNRLLVYEYMRNGSLADILFTNEKQPCWSQRMNIACSIAKGLVYLHEECETRIIHCDIKPQNILMDENMCAKISDFGLAKLLMEDQTRTFTGIRGTRGYVAPEWHKKLPITVKADVYSFGIVLLEIICCRRSVDLKLSENEAILEEWVYKCFQAGDLSILVAVGDEVVEYKQLERMVSVGLWCIQYEPSLRPSMKMVQLMLEGTVDVPLPPPASFIDGT